MFIQNVNATTLENAMKTLGDSGGSMNRDSGVYSINQVHNLNSQGLWNVAHPNNDRTTTPTRNTATLGNGTLQNGICKTGRLTLNGNFAGYYDLAYWNGNLTMDKDDHLGAFLESHFFTGNTDTHSALIYINGDLNIHYPVILKPTVRKLFFCLYVAGDLTLDGFISMTDRGANHSGKSNSCGYTAPIAIPLNGSVTIPATGGAGGASAYRTTQGDTYNAGGTATNGSGGGGSGRIHVSTGGGQGPMGAGAAGTCFSSGATGGGLMLNSANVSANAEMDAEANGGPGGTCTSHSVSYSGSSGGLGNPQGYNKGIGGNNQVNSSYNGNSVLQPTGFMEDNYLDPWKGVGTERGPGRYVDGGHGTAGTFIAICTGDYTGNGRIDSKGHNHGNYHEIGGNNSGGARGGAGGGGIGIVLGGTGTRTGPTPNVNGGSVGNNYGGAAGGAGTGSIVAL